MLIISGILSMTIGSLAVQRKHFELLYLEVDGDIFARSIVAVAYQKGLEPLRRNIRENNIR